MDAAARAADPDGGKTFLLDIEVRGRFEPHAVIDLMADGRPQLLLVYEPEAACRARLLADGFPPERALEITSYLAQSTDLALEFDAIAEECGRRGLAFAPVELDDAAAALADRDPKRTLVWTLTDGVAYFRGGAAPALARLNGLADHRLRRFAVCALPGQVPRRRGAAGARPALARMRAGARRRVAGRAAAFARRLVRQAEPARDRRSASGRIRTATISATRWSSAAACSPAYRDAVVVQPYVAGRNVRASFLAVEPQAGAERLAAFFVDSGADFQTMADSLALYGETGASAKAEGKYEEPKLVAVADAQPAAAAGDPSALPRR